MNTNYAIEKIKKVILELAPTIGENLSRKDEDSQEAAFKDIIRCLEMWPPSTRYFQHDFLKGLSQLVSGSRLHFQYIFTSTGEFLIGGTHESIQKYRSNASSVHAGNISFTGCENGYFLFYVDEGSSATGKKMGRLAPAPWKLTEKMNLYVPKDIRQYMKFEAVPGTDALLWKR